MSVPRTQATLPNMKTVESPTTVAVNRKWPTLSSQDKDNNGPTEDNVTDRGAGEKGTALFPSKSQDQVTWRSDEE